MLRRGAESFIDWCNSLFNALSVIFFSPVFIICYIYRMLYLTFNWTFDFEIGLEVVYNLGLCVYILFIISIIFGVII